MKTLDNLKQEEDERRKAAGLTVCSIPPNTQKLDLLRPIIPGSVISAHGRFVGDRASRIRRFDSFAITTARPADMAPDVTCNASRAHVHGVALSRYPIFNLRI